MTVSDGPSATPAGWYPDPADPARLRRWDGTAWTSDVTLLAPPDPTPTPAPIPTPPPAPPIVEPEPESQETRENTAIPDWANLPGITLPPDWGNIPGLSSNPGLAAPAFDEPVREQPQVSPLASAPPPQAPSPAASTPIVLGPNGEFPTRRQLRELRELGDDRGAPSTPEAPPRATSAPTAPEAPYAPPPSGVQYIAPHPPGVPYVMPAETARPASDFGMRTAAPPINNGGADAAAAPPPGFDDTIATPSSASSSQPQVNALPLSAPARAVAGAASGINTVGVWLIAVLPLLQFVVLYVVFSVLGASFLPGTQWGILAAPAIFSLIFALIDRRMLLARGNGDVPNLIWAIVPPLYLIVRAVRFGTSAIAPLVTWVVLQAAAAVGISLLLSALVASVLGT